MNKHFLKPYLLDTKMDYTDNQKKRINEGDIREITSDNPRIFQDPDNVKTDIQGSNAVKNSFCPFCNYKTFELDSLKSHIEITHTIVKCKKCPYCKLTNLSQVNLNHHIRANHWDKLIHKCNVCEYRTAKESNLNSHKRSIHTKDKCYECNICGYRAVLPSKLKYHRATTHKIEKPYSCPMCNYKAAISSTLKTHIMAKHEKKKPHQCPKCKYKATQIGTLNKHLACHFKSKPYSFKNSNIGASNETKGGAHVNFTDVGIPSVDTQQVRNQQNWQCSVDRSSEVKGLLSDFITFDGLNNPSSPYRCHICCYSAIDESSLNLHLMTQHTKQYLDIFSKRHEQTLRMCRIE